MSERRRIWERRPFLSVYVALVVVTVFFQVAANWWLV